MTDTDIIFGTVAYVKEKLKDAEGGHDWWHINRVWQNALTIGKVERGDHLIIQLAALLHDIADPKFHNGDESIGPQKAEAFMRRMPLHSDVIDHVVSIIRHMSFKNSFEPSSFDSLELRIVQDADRLDAIGAIGIARAFNYGGFKNMPLYDPDIKPLSLMTKEKYKNSKSPTINHFYEKLLLLKDKMNTSTGKRMAEERHQYMLQFLDQFYREWSPEKS